MKSWQSKVFRSGNSAAIRLPKALGLVDGDEVAIVSHANGSFSFWKKDQALEVLLSLYGAFSPRFMASGRDDTEQDERDWSRSGVHDGDTHEEAA